MAKRAKYKFSIEGKPLYPHIKLTRERFPRILATRLIADDDSEYFGAFLNRTNARILLDFLNRTFRLRSCDLEIDGSFNYPCTMYYKRRCIAPCVRDLADVAAHDEMAGLVRLFLSDDRALLGSVLHSKINAASDELDFESAAKWRDILESVGAFWSDSRRSVWLDATSDTITYRITQSGMDVILISQKGRRVLGERIFAFETARESDAAQAISEVVQQFYLFHAPKEIRVSKTLPDDQQLEELLQERVGRKVRIVRLTEKNRKVSTDLAVFRSSAELDVKRSIANLSIPQLLRSLKSEFNLAKIPKRITAIDVSHLSGTYQVAAAISWSNGRIDPAGSRYWLSDSSSELGSMQRFVSRFVSGRATNENELLLIDGGIAQLNAAMSVVLPANISIISAVKPPGKHESIAYFLTPKMERIEFDMPSESHRLLQSLRDEAHNFGNAVHRDTRDHANYYRLSEMLPSLTETERSKLLKAFGSISKITSSSDLEPRRSLAEDRAVLAVADLERFRLGRYEPVLPLVVPTRLQEVNAAAEDLRPIEARS